MSKPRYQPPEQSRSGQIVDSVFLLVLVYATLFAPLVLGITGGGTIEQEVTEPTWEKLGQNAVMQQQWEKLGHTPESAAPIITTRFDYSVNPIALVLTAAVIVGYFVLVLRISDKEYRQVIAERFGEHPER